MLDHVLLCKQNQPSIEPSPHQGCFHMMEMKVIFQKGKRHKPHSFLIHHPTIGQKIQRFIAMLHSIVCSPAHRWGIPVFSWLNPSSCRLMITVASVQSQVVLVKSHICWSNTHVCWLNQSKSALLLPVKHDHCSWFLIFKWAQITSGWWFEPLWKILKSVGVIKLLFPIYGKKTMFQTTNQT